MSDYPLTRQILSAIGWGFLIASVLGIVLSLWLPKTKWGKGIAFACVAFLIGIPIRGLVIEQQELKAKKADYDKRFAVANAIFQERCKTAGEKIYRTVKPGEKVDGLLLLNVPKSGGAGEDRDELDAALRGFHGHSYAYRFLTGYGPESRPKLMSEEAFRAYFPVFDYVEMVDPEDGIRYRYDKKLPGSQYHRIVSPDAKPPRYAVEIEYNHKFEDRVHWIAHGRIKIIDTLDDFLMSEFHAVAFETGFGSSAGQRTPWIFANACSSNDENYPSLPRQLAVRTLKPNFSGATK